MNEKLDAVTKTVQCHCDRVDEKRHIVVDELNDRCVRVPTIPSILGVEDADDGNAATAASSPGDMAQGRRSQRFRIAMTQVFLVYADKVGPQESGPAAWHTLACCLPSRAADDRVEEIASVHKVLYSFI